MKLVSSVKLELEITGVFYNKDFILIVVELDKGIKHVSDESKTIREFLIKTNEPVLSDSVEDYEELVYFDKRYMDFYDYPLLEILYENYENFIETIIPYIVDYAKEHSLNVREYKVTSELVKEIREKKKSKEQLQTQKSALFKFLNSGPRWLLNSQDRK